MAQPWLGPPRNRQGALLGTGQASSSTGPESAFWRQPPASSRPHGEGQSIIGRMLPGISDCDRSQPCLPLASSQETRRPLPTLPIPSCRPNPVLQYLPVAYDSVDLPRVLLRGCQFKLPSPPSSLPSRKWTTLAWPWSPAGVLLLARHGSPPSLQARRPLCATHFEIWSGSLPTTTAPRGPRIASTVGRLTRAAVDHRTTSSTRPTSTPASASSLPSMAR